MMTTKESASFYINRFEENKSVFEVHNIKISTQGLPFFHCIKSSNDDYRLTQNNIDRKNVSIKL